MAVDEREVIRREIRIDARPETVYQFLTDPARIVRWQGALAEFEQRSGGRYRVEYNGRDIALGTVLEIVPNQRVVFSWGWEGSRTVPPGSTTVEITLTPEGTGTLLTLEHRDLPDAEREKHALGWELYTNRLALAAAGRDPGPDPNAGTGRM